MTYEHVQLERLRPAELQTRLALAPVGYIPFGATEYHGRQNPVGLDSIKAHQLLVRLADRVGGVVAPPLFYGVGGGHLEFEWTWMVEIDALVSILVSTMLGMEKSGCKVIVLMSGHYPNDELFEPLQEAFKRKGGSAKLLFMIDHMAFDNEGEMRGDHASKWETSYLLALAPETVDMQVLQQNDDGRPLSDFETPKPSAPGGWWFEKNTAHPFYGIAAQENNFPTDASKELGEKSVLQVLDWAEIKVKAAIP